MIEIRIGKQLFPAGSAVAFLAILSELSPVHIFVAVGAILKCDARKPGKCRVVRCAIVALFFVAIDTFYIPVQSGQPEFGFVVIKTVGRFPTAVGVTFQTIFRQLPAMLIRMAG